MRLTGVIELKTQSEHCRANQATPAAGVQGRNIDEQRSRNSGVPSYTAVEKGPACGRAYDVISHPVIAGIGWRSGHINGYAASLPR
jgi:hypothetical protein